MQWITGIWDWWRNEGFQFRQNWRWYLAMLAMVVGFVGIAALTTIIFDSTDKYLAREERIAAELAAVEQEVQAAYYERCMRYSPAHKGDTDACDRTAQQTMETPFVDCSTLEKCKQSLEHAQKRPQP